MSSAHDARTQGHLDRQAVMGDALSTGDGCFPLDGVT